MSIPEGSTVQSRTNTPTLVPAGFIEGQKKHIFSHKKITEHVAYSWYEDYPDGLHPSKGITAPYFPEHKSHKYSWSKAPRYDSKPAETGPLAEMIMTENPLFTDLLNEQKPNVFIRQLARILRPTELLPALDTWLKELNQAGEFYRKSDKLDDGQGVGLIHASRGALGHWVQIKNGKISHYQIVTPTAWHSSPRDTNGIRGEWEEALVGTVIKDPDHPIELGHIVRSYDACLVCAVHAIQNRAGRSHIRITV